MTYLSLTASDQALQSVYNLEEAPVFAFCSTESSTDSRDSHRLRSASRTNYHCIHWEPADYRDDSSSSYRHLTLKISAFSFSVLC